MCCCEFLSYLNQKNSHLLAYILKKLINSFRSKFTLIEPDIKVRRKKTGYNVLQKRTWSKHPK